MKRGITIIFLMLLFCSIVSASFFDITGSSVLESQEKSIYSILKGKINSITGFITRQPRSICGDNECDLKERIRYRYYGTCTADCGPEEINTEQPTPVFEQPTQVLEKPNPLRGTCGDGLCSYFERIKYSLLGICPEDCASNFPDKRNTCTEDADCFKADYPVCVSGYCYEEDYFSCEGRSGYVDENCPVELPICVNDICERCYDTDNEDEEVYGSVAGYTELMGHFDAYDKCSYGIGSYFGSHLVEYGCYSTTQIYDSTDYTGNDYCVFGQYNVDESCTVDGDCATGEICYEGYCTNAYKDFLDWVDTQGYDQDFINMYRDGIENQEDWAEEWWLFYLLQKDEPQLNKRLKQFKEGELEVVLHFVKEPNADFNYPEWTEDDVAEFQGHINNVFGMDDGYITVTKNVTEIEYEDMFDCVGCSYTDTSSYYNNIFSFYEPDGTETSEVVEFSTIRQFSGMGQSYFTQGEEYSVENDYGHFVCSTDKLNFYIFLTIIDSDARMLVLTSGCGGKSECNAMCSYSLYIESDRIIHEIGHVLGFEHPYDSNDNIMLPESMMIQNPHRSTLGIVPLYSPIEYYQMEPFGGYDNLTGVVTEYNANAVYTEYTVVNTN
ncbi:MAG: hypothetical protein ABIF40_00115 [archaeon]